MATGIFWLNWFCGVIFCACCNGGNVFCCVLFLNFSSFCITTWLLRVLLLLSFGLSNNSYSTRLKFLFNTLRLEFKVFNNYEISTFGQVILSTIIVPWVNDIYINKAKAKQSVGRDRNKNINYVNQHLKLYIWNLNALLINY